MKPRAVLFSARAGVGGMCGSEDRHPAGYLRVKLHELHLVTGSVTAKLYRYIRPNGKPIPCYSGYTFLLFISQKRGEINMEGRVLEIAKTRGRLNGESWPRPE